MVNSNKHICNLNRTLKDIKSDILVDFIQFDYYSLIIITNKVVVSSDLNVIENYIKNLNTVNPNNIQTTCLPQSKLYLKILGIFYLIEGINISINSSIVEFIIKSIHIFDNIHISLRLCIIKISPKSDIFIIQINIYVVATISHKDQQCCGNHLLQ